MVGPVVPAAAVVEEVGVAAAGGDHHGLLAPDPGHAGEDQGPGLGKILVVGQSLLQVIICVKLIRFLYKTLRSFRGILTAPGMAP